MARPSPVTTRPPATPNAGRTIRATTGARTELSTTDREDGSDHSAASQGDRPTTSCRYWAKKRNVPKAMNPVMAFDMTDTVNLGMRKSFGSINGSSSLICRRTKATPIVTPATIVRPAIGPKPFWAICFSP
jgi:hypothetical protein